MILDQTANACLYAAISPGIGRVLEMLQDTDLMDRADGRYEIDGSNLFCLVQTYTTRTADQCKLETHERYIDLQWMVRGEEAIGHCHPEGLEIQQPYDAELDRTFYHPREGMSEIRLQAGMFAIFFPHDAHQPCLQADGPGEVRKIVFKIRVRHGC